jgi:hypothetical protein
MIDLCNKLRIYFIRESASNSIFALFDWFYNFILSVGILPNHRPCFWSVYNRTKFKMPRTTNSLEGFHRHLNNVCVTNNPSLFSLGDELVNEQFFVSKYLIDSHKDFFVKGSSFDEKRRRSNVLLTILKIIMMWSI